ncbi:unnamed protein product [Prunus armeniaca]|uniref:Uncharacterized protein n=1 Tax=Prunus armeniaca TaxID=36596 RepID=A0A6J5XHH6_PRUAR|nr:unnamed protein product [Prunus armeniaca]
MASEKDDSLQVLPPKRSPTVAVVSSRRESSTGPTVSLTAEQFHKLCSTHQPNALSMISHSSGLPSSSSSGTSMSLAGIGSITTSGLCLSDDPHSKKLIGTGRREGGLYVLERL